MKYKLLVIDVDGTLLNDQKEITAHTRSAIMKAQQMGVHIVLSSGRPTGGILPIARSLELNNYGGYVISYNGAQIIDMATESALFDKRLDPSLFPYLDKKAKKNNFAIFTYIGENILTDHPENPHVIQEAKLNNMQIKSVPNFPEATLRLANVSWQAMTKRNWSDWKIIGNGGWQVLLKYSALKISSSKWFRLRSIKEIPSLF